MERPSASESFARSFTAKLGALLGVAGALAWTCIAVQPAQAAVVEVKAVGLTVSDLGREARFFCEVLMFDLVSRSESEGPALDRLLNLRQSQVRVAELRLGGERITLAQHPAHQGRPIPADSRSYDRWFQHLAIVVSDMDKAYEQLRRRKVKQVSTGPQTLPAWNTNVAGIRAFYFRDPEEHVLELIWFPPGKGDPKWQSRNDHLFLGIDHTALVVSDTDASLAFYRDRLGMRVAGGSENYGVEQEHLNQVFGARLRITSLRAESGPGVEFLEYISPPGGRAFPDDARANDLFFWHTDMRVDNLDQLADGLKRDRARFISESAVVCPGLSPASARRWIVRDPDGHAVQFIEENGTPSLSGQRKPLADALR